MTLADTVKQLEHDLRHAPWFVRAAGVADYDTGQPKGRARSAILATVTRLPDAIPEEIYKRASRSRTDQGERCLYYGRRLFWLLRCAAGGTETLKQTQKRLQGLLAALDRKVSRQPGACREQVG